MNTSATGGYLSPVGALIEDADLDAAFQKAVVGITGLAGQYVRPRWQAVAPKQPEPSIDWCGIGVTTQEADQGPVFNHDGAGDGQDEYARHEEIKVDATFYGPHGAGYAARFRDGIAINQNIEALNIDSIAFVSCGQIVSAPELVNQQWIKRFDLTVMFRRRVSRIYPVLNILSAPTAIVNDKSF